MDNIILKLREQLGATYNDPELIGKIASMAVEIADDDQAYVPEQLSRLLDKNDQCHELKRRIIERLKNQKDFDEVACFVLANEKTRVLSPKECAPVFQEYYLRLRQLEKGDRDLAIATMMYGVSMALYEWKDRQRGSVPYDPETHGPIYLSVTSSKKTA